MQKHFPTQIRGFCTIWLSHCLSAVYARQSNKKGFIFARKSPFGHTEEPFLRHRKGFSGCRKSLFRTPEKRVSPVVKLFSDSSYERNGDMEQQERHSRDCTEAMPFLFYRFQTVKNFYFSHSLSVHAKQLRRHGGKATDRPQADQHQSPRAVTSAIISRATAAITAALAASVSAESFMKTVM